MNSSVKDFTWTCSICMCSKEIETRQCIGKRFLESSNQIFEELLLDTRSKYLLFLFYRIIEKQLEEF